VTWIEEEELSNSEILIAEEWYACLRIIIIIVLY
jgi:hypothetical protein